MKHWIVVGCCVIAGTVMLFRSRITPRQTLPVPTTLAGPTTVPSEATP